MWTIVRSTVCVLAMILISTHADAKGGGPLHLHSSVGEWRPLPPHSAPKSARKPLKQRRLRHPNPLPRPT
jgi:hypothetical protein